MITENENLRNGSDENQENASENGYGRTYNREQRFNSYNREEGGQRPYRPNNYNRTGGGYNRPERSYRPRFTRNAEGEGEQQRTYTNRYPRQPRNYDNYGGGEARPNRPAYNRGGSYGNNRMGGRYTPENGGGNGYAPNGEERQWRNYNRGNGAPNGGGFYRNNNGEERPAYNRRPNYNNGNGYNNNGYNNGYGNGGFRPQRNNFRPRTADYNPNAKYSRKKQIEYKEILADPDAPIRLNKFLANAGICSRREADEFITAGVVSVNGEVVTELGTKVKRTDEIKFHDEPVNAERKVYILLNKPKDCVTTTDDPQERKTVMELVKGACNERIYPVGRLDRNTTGVLLLTNDGDLASKLTHPKFLKKKIYHVYCDKNVTKADLDQIASGITLDDGEIHADAISYAHETDKKQVGIEIHSGKNRIVRRIFESLGYRVTKLDRVFFAGLTKKGLRRGDWRFLTEKEVNMLRMGAFE